MTLALVRSSFSNTSPRLRQLTLELQFCPIYHTIPDLIVQCCVPELCIKTTFNNELAYSHLSRTAGVHNDP